MRVEGVVAEWDDARGFGFITPAGGGRRVFVHVSALPRGRRPGVGDRVGFVWATDERGPPRAAQVRLAGRGTGRAATPLRRAVAGAAVFALAVAALTTSGRLPAAIAVTYLALSLVTVLLYRADKSAAQQRQRRIPENTLHLAALLGGWPGALVARQLLRHKTTKQPFRTVFWVTVAVNVAALAAYVLSQG